MGRDTQYDLLTAALLGVAVGAGAALLLGGGTGYRRQRRHPMRVAARRGARWAGRRGAALGAMPVAVRGQVEEYLSAARDTISDAVESELSDLRRSIRRRRKRLGI
ncbi:MAG TPA: hypothetical protein VFY16_04135 [Gemmatimonadaceae bacterium]|jgi:hypothetical protein|nr:hypothetical protein [Gemmatimonadaceae bacterium]